MCQSFEAERKRVGVDHSKVAHEDLTGESLLAFFHFHNRRIYLLCVVKDCMKIYPTGHKSLEL